MGTPSRPGAAADAHGLVRVIGRWTLVALTLNSVIGSGIYGVPAETIRLIGSAAPFATLLAAIGVGVITACFAEVGSQFREAGGLYLYAREVFGRLVGIQMGWMALLVRVTAHAAIANLLVTYLGELVPAAVEPGPRAAIILTVAAVLAAVNIVGVASGARVSNLVTIAKLLPLTVFAVAGVSFAASRLPAPALTGTPGDWMQAVLLLIFAFGGFESALVPMGEVRNPRRDVPFALAVSLGVCTCLYIAIHVAVLAVPAAQGSPRPVAEAARAFLGPQGGTFMAVAAILSILGIQSAGMIATPRLLYALADRGEFPRALASVHPRFRTPWVAVLVYAGATCALALGGGFVWNAVLSVVGRLFTYGVVCLALLRLRASRPGADAYRAPGGSMFAYLGLAFSITLVVGMGAAEFLVLGTVVLLALANWWWVAYGPAAASRVPEHSSADL